jgi:undecaprenyl-diphosphatase
MLAASGYDLLKHGSAFSADQFWLLAVGLVMSFLTAWVAIKFLLNFIRRHNFTSFGIYRIAAAVVFFWVLVR